MYEKFERILGFSPIPEKYRHLVPDYSLINGLNIQLSYFISGKIPYTEDAFLFLQTEMVSSFLKKVMNIENVNEDIKFNELYENTSNLLEKIGNRIILDRTTIIPNKQTNMSITDTDKERMKSKLELQNQNYLERQKQTQKSHKTQKKSALKPFDRSRIIPFSQIRPTKSKDNEGDVLNTVTVKKSVAKGGKKRRTRKIRRNKKEVN